MKESNLLKSILVVLVLFLIVPTYAQNKEDIQNFFEEHSSQILSLAHKNSTLISSQVEVIESDDSDFEYKVIVTINYKGFIKNNIIKCYVYFEDYPRKFIWGNDTNTYKINSPPDTVLEELKDKWSKYKY